MAELEQLSGLEFDGYRVTRHLARGGMADVYLADELELGRQVVLKVMLSLLAQDMAFAARFRREGQMTARLNHPNIIQVYRTGTTPDGRPYLAMQYVRGGSLQQILLGLAGSDQILTTEAALLLVRQIADVLSAAHQAGIVHRDLKPSNILLHPNGTPVVTDLGIAAVSAASRLTRTGDVMGTPHYMSPEQASGTRIDARADVYSLGVILYELLAGAVPFQGDSPLVVLHQHVYEPPPALQQVRPDLTPETLQLVQRCLQKEADARWQSADELRAAVDGALAAERARMHGPRSAGAATLDQTLARGRVLQTPAPRPAAPVPASGAASGAAPPGVTPPSATPPGAAANRRMPAWAWGIFGLLALVILAIVAAPRLFGGGEPPAEGALPDGVTPAETADFTAPAETETAVLPSLTPLPAPAATVTLGPPTAVPPTLPPPQPGEIAFQSNRDGDFEIYIMDETGGNQRQLTVNDVGDQYPVASPDGTQLVFQSERDGNWEIYVMNADGSGQRRLTNSPASERLPTWSADGRQVAFLSNQDGDYELYTINADGSGLRQVTNSGLRVGHTSWSISGRLVFNAGTLDGDTWELYTIDASGSGLQQLTDNTVSDWSPEWSPDGTKILYLRAVGRNDPAIYIMDADGGNARPLYNSPDYEWGADWTPDGRILFTRESGSFSYIYIMDGDGRNATLLTERGSYPTWVRK